MTCWLFRSVVEISVAMLHLTCCFMHTPPGCCSLQFATRGLFSVPVAGLLSVLTGWAIQKPMQLHWLTAIFGGYDKAGVSRYGIGDRPVRVLRV